MTWSPGCATRGCRRTRRRRDGIRRRPGVRGRRAVMRVRKLSWLAGLGGLALAGCLGDEPAAESYFRRPEPPPAPPQLAPASTEAAGRVDAIGRRILAANPQAGARPMFRTIGAPQPELFHRGTSDVYVTE